MAAYTEREESMNKKQKAILIAAFIAVLAVIGVIAGVLNHRKTQEGAKTFTVEIVSERDEYSSTEECTSDAEYLGDFLRTFEPCIWEDAAYGFYLKGFYDIEEDMNNQYWWCVFINGESATSGAETIVLEDGAVYTFMLKQGWD